MDKRINIMLIALIMAALAQSPCTVFAAKGDFNYDPLGKRDPFVPLVGISSLSSASGALGITTIDDVVLGGIMTDPGGVRSVVINGEILYQGESVGRLYIESVEKNLVTIRIDDIKYELELYEREGNE